MHACKCAPFKISYPETDHDHSSESSHLNTTKHYFNLLPGLCMEFSSTYQPQEILKERLVQLVLELYYLKKYDPYTDILGTEHENRSVSVPYNRWCFMLRTKHTRAARASQDILGYTFSHCRCILPFSFLSTSGLINLMSPYSHICTLAPAPGISESNVQIKAILTLIP